MRKSKKLLSLLMALLLLLGSLSIAAVGTHTVFAAAGDVFYFEKPADWGSDLYVYWWSGSAAPSWPGVKMTKMSDTVYSFTATSSFTDFNINDGGEGNTPTPHQTVDLKLPANGKMGVVGKSAGKNGYGNECWNVSWTELNGIGVSVFASIEDCEFIESLKVELSVIEAAEGTYSINGSTEKTFKNGDEITIGADGKVGDVFVLTLKAGEGADAVSKTYTYTKTDSPVGASIVYFDNSRYNWDNVYCYAYGTKENGEWPGQAMSYDSKSELYYLTFSSAYTSESIIFNDGIDGDVDGSEQYPEAGGLSLKVGQCKLLTEDLQWVDYGKPDSKPYGFAYISDNTKFSGDVLNVDIDLKNAVKGSYSIDGGAEFEYTERTTVAVGQGKIGNSDITLTLKAQSADGQVSVTELTYHKTFKATQTTFYSPTDGATTAALTGNYATNPNMQLGKYSSSITVDGDPSDWDNSMLIAQGVANDDPRVYMSSAIHERAVDDYALYAAWDDENLYFMWEMANVSGVLGGDSIFSAQKPNGSIWNPGLPVYLVLSVDPAKHADGKARELDAKTNKWIESDSVWGSLLSFGTNVDTFIAFDTANTNGGAAIIPLDDEGYFNYTQSINIGRPTNDAGVLNRNGFEIAWDYGTFSDTVIGVNGYGGSRTIGDTYTDNSEWVNFFEEGYDADDGFIYEIKIPMEHLGIDRSYIEENGIGAMLISTFGTSAMNTLPHDPSVLDNANVSYSFDPSTSHEKEDADNITVPLARIGALLSDTVIEEAPLELNFGTDKSGAQKVDTEINLKAEVYGTDESYELIFKADGKEIASSGNTAKWVPSATGTYKLTASVKTASGKTAEKTVDFTIGEAVEVIITPNTDPVEPTLPTKPGGNPTNPVNPTEPSSTSGETKPGNNNETLPDSSAPATDATENPVITVPGGSDGPIVVPGTNASTPSTTDTSGLILGDADNNGKVNIKDATLIQKHAAKLTTIADECFVLADVNSDLKINVKDATAIQKYLANIAVDYPIGQKLK